jgi:chorismate synthase
MATLRFVTAGESHGPQLTAVIEGLPAGFPLCAEDINIQLARRQVGYGRGGRMLIEKDQVEITSGVRWGETLGGPVTLVVRNRDWENWLKKMSPEAEHQGKCRKIDRPRPGHADLGGIMKYDRSDIRDILERASARETTMRVAVGAVARKLLSLFGMEVIGYVAEMNGITAKTDTASLNYREKASRSEASQLRVLCPEQEQEIITKIDEITGSDTMGGIYQIEVHNPPIGLGSHVQWRNKLDGRIARAVLSIQAHKGVEFGLGMEYARRPGSKAHDEILLDDDGKIIRASNNAGGIEGGMTNSQPIVVRAVMKPISTLKRALRSVNMSTGLAEEAVYERSDVTAVPAASVVGENAIAWEVARAFVEKFGGDSMTEMRNNYDSYMKTANERMHPGTEAS